MPDLCDITKQAVDDIKAQNESMDRIEEEEFHSKVHIRTSIMDKLNKKLNDKFGSNVVKSHEWKEVVDELYGKKDDRTRLAVEVLAILNAHKNYWKWAKRYILLNLPDRRKIDVTETGIDLSSLPESVLVNMHKKYITETFRSATTFFSFQIIYLYIYEILKLSQRITTSCKKA